MDKETGRFDIDIIATGRSHSQQQSMRTIIDIIQKICTESKDGTAEEKDIYTEAEIHGIDTLKVKNALERMVRDGQIYEPSHNRYRLTND
jgi:replicative DNA helicase Mcm